MIEQLKTIRSELTSLHGIVGDLSEALAACAQLEAMVGEQKPVAWIEHHQGSIAYNPYPSAARQLPDGVRFDLYTAAPVAQQPRTALEQYDLDQSPEYRKGWDAGRIKGYEVGYRHATEHAAAKAQQPQADSIPVAAFDRLMALCESQAQRIIELEDKQPQAEKRCQYCDGTGDVHSIDGQWLGECHCQKQPQAEHSLRQDALQTLAYVNGAKHGWNLAVADDEAGFQRLTDRVPEAMQALKQPQAEAVPADQSKWCAYVAGVIGCYLGEADDSAKVKAIAGIIERRMWASAHQPLKIAAWRGVHVEGDYLYYDEFPEELTNEQRRQLHLKPLYEGAAPQQAEAVPSSDLNPDEGDPVTLWAEIWRLREAVKGPDGYATWQDAATAERIRRVRAESKHATPPAQQYEAGDMASAAAQGFRDGVASVTQQEPVAWAMPKGDGTFIDVITPAEHARDEGSYTVPLFAHPVAQQPQARPDFTDEWTGYLKDGETPFERFLRERKDLQSVLKLYQRVLEENERLKAQQPQAEPDIHEAQGQIEFLDKKNNALSAAIRKVMARLADLLDEDQFKEIEETISSAGVQPQAEAVPLTHVLVPVDEPTDEMVDAACAAVDGLCRVDFVRAYVAAFAHLKAGYRDESYWCGWNAAIKFQQAEAVPSGVVRDADVKAAAKKMAEIFDYPWDFMPEKGRNTMRENVRAVLTAAQGEKP